MVDSQLSAGAVLDEKERASIIRGRAGDLKPQPVILNPLAVWIFGVASRDREPASSQEISLGRMSGMVDGKLGWSGLYRKSATAYPGQLRHGACDLCL
jgi:hypothetical protein